MIAPARVSKQPRPTKLTYTVQEFAALSGISPSTLYHSIKQGRFSGPVITACNSRRIPAWWVHETLGITAAEIEAAALATSGKAA